MKIVDCRQKFENLLQRPQLEKIRSISVKRPLVKKTYMSSQQFFTQVLTQRRLGRQFDKLKPMLIIFLSKQDLDSLVFHEFLFKILRFSKFLLGSWFH